MSEPDSRGGPGELFALTGRTAVVTGGGGPLGRVLAAALAAAGARVVAVDREQGLVDTAVRALASHPDGHLGVVCDLLAEGALDDLAARLGDVGACDVLVNNAALTGTSAVPGYAVPFHEQSDEAFELATRLNLLVPFSLTRRLAPLLGRSGSGSVVNVSSIYGLVGPNMGLYGGTAMGNPAAYAATKGGLAQLTRYLATVLAPQVRVNAVAPGGIARGQDPAFVERYETLTPLGRMASEDDLRGAVTWLAGPAAAYVTGQVIAVDGGWTAW
jgi:NAD(P)-dependent dehydrogenase (short-subunit alcohol dehydrogenase family)